MLVAGVDGVVGVEVVVGVDVGVLVDVDVVVVVEVVFGCVVVVVVVGVLEVWVVVETPALHCCLARVWTAWAPCPRSCTRVGLIDPGRFATWVSSASIALLALAQLPFASAVEAALSWLFSELA
ncbi:MAG TPA: hypothetical protein VG186_10910 [Solirubrobacteraceae bacterium]|nr:hypothetical protein [Solirubrobacteraceae bacterium]